MDAPVFLDVTVVPMTDERVVEGQTVVIRDGAIVEIGPSDDVVFSETATIVRGEAPVPRQWAWSVVIFVSR
jgi:imidazolonepropionase-like amidohydrolase